jgi:protocatechuate 3,4-dioxygenase beta subunit
VRAITRRQALTTLAGAGVGALTLAACGNGSRDAGDEAGSGGTSPGGSATTTAPASGALTAEMFDAATSCALTPEATEGPYYFDVDAMRRDIREDREGATLRLGLRVLDRDGCSPVSDAVVELWHCDAAGSYSGFETASSGGGGTPPAGPGGGTSTRTDDESYLRGGQLTDRAGIVEFTTVYPGWYRGRTVHIHANVHLDNATALTTQLFFDEAFTARVYETEPYASRTGRDTFNADDSIFDERLLLDLSETRDRALGLLTLVVATP